MSSITIHSRKKDIAPCSHADANHAHPACRECSISRHGREFGWSSSSTCTRSRRFSHQCWEAVHGLDVRCRAKHLPDRERFSQQRQAIRGVISAHTNLSTLRQQRAADRCRFGNRPEGSGNTTGTLCRRPPAGARRVLAGHGAGLRHARTSLRAGRRWFATIYEPTDVLQNEPQAVVYVPTSRAQRVVRLTARCTQRMLLRKTQELRCMTEHVMCRFECSRSAPNVPATGKESTDD